MAWLVQAWHVVHAGPGGLVKPLLPQRWHLRARQGAWCKSGPGRPCPSPQQPCPRARLCEPESAAPYHSTGKDFQSTSGLWKSPISTPERNRILLINSGRAGAGPWKQCQLRPFSCSRIPPVIPATGRWESQRLQSCTTHRKDSCIQCLCLLPTKHVERPCRGLLDSLRWAR